MQGRDAGSHRDNWDKPAKGDNPDRKSPRPSKVTGVKHKASDLVSENKLAKESQKRKERKADETKTIHAIQTVKT
jgi:hypothetical protein